jgi:hypothetical protein
MSVVDKMNVVGGSDGKCMALKKGSRVWRDGVGDTVCRDAREI